MNLSDKQREALRMVAEGRVTWGDPAPRRAARTGRVGALVFMVDGAEVYGGEHATFSSLSERGLIDAPLADGEIAVAATLTDAGKLALAGEGR